MVGHIASRFGCALVVAVMAFVTTGACAPFGEAPPHDDGPPIRIVYDRGYAPCAGTETYLNAVAARQASLLGYPLPRRIDYHLVPTLNGTPCGGRDALMGGCEIGTTGAIWALVPAETHELVHAIVGEAAGTLVPFFTEGVAVAFGDPNNTGADYSLPMEELLGPTWPLPSGYYGTAGDFVSFLFTRYGSERLRALFREVPLGTSSADTDGALRRTYGKSFAELVAERLGSGLVFDQSHLAVPECGEPTAWASPPWSRSVEVACDAGGVGLLSSDRSGPRGRDRGRPPRGLLLAPRITSPASIVHFDLALEPGGAATACDASIAPEILDASSSGVQLVPRLQDAPVLSKNFRVASARHATAQVRDAALSLCSGGCDAGCSSLEDGNGFTLEPGKTYILVAKATARGGHAGLAFDLAP